MDLQVFISTLDNTVENINYKTKEFNDLTIINQIPTFLTDKSELIEKEGINWINIDQKGLSKSRNYAISIAETELVYFTDDDIVLEKDFSKIIKKAFKKNPDADILAFHIQGIEKEFKKKGNKQYNINYLNSMKLSSVQLVYRLRFLKKHGLLFDERFGTGSIYKMGEENIMLFDALKKGASIKYIPETIAKLHIGVSSWFNGFNKKYFFDRGAIYGRMFGYFAPMFLYIFCFSKRELYTENLSVSRAFIYTLRGMKEII